MQKQRWQDFGYTMPTIGAQAPTLVAGETYTKRQPARPASVESDVLTPFWQAVITATGVAVAGLFGLLLWFSIDGGWLLQIRYVFGFFLFLAVIFLVSWLLLLNAHRHLLWFIEKIAGKDLDGDGAEGKPEKEPFRFEHSDPQKRTVKYDEVPATKEEMTEVANAVLQLDCPLSRRKLSEATSLSEEAADKLLSKMRETGLAKFKPGGPNEGTELTNKGRALLNALLSS